MYIVTQISENNKKRKNSSYLSWIKDHVSEIDLGEEVDGAEGRHPIHLNTNAQIQEHFKRLQDGQKSFLPNQYTWENLINHGTGVETFYFAGAPDTRKQFTLFLIDVDCKEIGTPEGAEAYLEYLASRQCHKEYGLSFSGLFIEHSTHGRGGHGFPLLDKQGENITLINSLLHHRLH